MIAAIRTTCWVGFYLACLALAPLALAMLSCLGARLLWGDATQGALFLVVAAAVLWMPVLAVWTIFDSKLEALMKTIVFIDLVAMILLLVLPIAWFLP